MKNKEVNLHKFKKSFLKDMLDNFGAVNLGASGPLFTWINKRNQTRRIRRRLDKVIIGAGWILNHPTTNVINNPITVSDNIPLILQTFLINRFLPRPFRYMEAWDCDPMCKTVVEQAWTSFVEGNAQINAASILNKKLAITTRSKWKISNNNRKNKS